MEYNILIILVVASLSVLLAAFIYFKNRKNKINISYAFFSLVVSLWCFGTAFFLLAPVDNFSSKFLAKFLYFFGGSTAPFFYYFSLVFGAVEKRIKLWKKIAIFSPTAIFFYLYFFTDEIIAGSFISSSGIKGILYGPLHLLFDVHIWIFFIIAFIELINRYRHPIAQNRLHILYITLGTYSILLISAVTNIIGPSFFNYFNLIWIGPTSVIVWLTIISYAILRHHLMDIQVIIRLGTIYTILFAIISSTFVFLSSLISQIISGPLSFLLPSFIIAIGFIPLKNFIENITDRFFFRKKINAEKFINQFNLIIRRYGLSLDSLLESFNKLVIDLLRVEQSAVCLLIPEGGFISRQIIGDQTKRIEFPPDHPITNLLINNPKEIIDKEAVKDNAIYGNIVKELEKINFSLVTPIELNGRLIGIYLIGRKKSQDSFTNEEIELLKLLTTESAFAIDNARLFENLKKIDDAKSKFISVVSHQLRTPLTSIRWNLELIQNENLKQKTNKELVNNIYKSTIFLTDHLDDMLTALDIEEKKIKPKKEESNFEEVLKESIEQYITEIKNKKISLALPPFGKIKPFLFDRLKIKKVISILLRNAILYNRPSGEIKISVEIKEINKTPNLIFSISDQGLGFIEDEKKNIFVKFYRSEEAKRISPNGFGLGLFIAKHFIEAHEGELWFSSEGRNKGSAFQFSLPIK